MMSLLLTFFIMLVSLSEVVADEKYRAVMEALHSYLGYSMAPAAPAGKNFPLNSLASRLETLGAFSNDIPKEERGTGGVTVEATQGTQLRVFRAREGTAITVGGELAFKKGMADILPNVDEIIIKIAEKLAGKPNKIEIRGHTSPGEVSQIEGEDDIHLSYRRARAVADRLVELGVKSHRMRISAAGDSEPIDDIGDEGTADHNRVSILVLDTYADEFVGTADLQE